MGQPVTGHFKLLFPSKYLSSADLKEKDVTVLVDRVEKDVLKVAGGKSEPKLVLHMRAPSGKALGKMLVLNKTNATTIAGLHGPKVELWKGRPVTLYPTTCKFGPATVDCVRVRARAGSAAGEVPEGLTEPVQDDDVPEDDFADAAAGPEDSLSDAAARHAEDARNDR